MRNRYSRLLFTSEDAFAPICACENNRRIWCHNASISRSRDVTDPLWWRHNATSETTVPGDNCKMSDRWLFLAELCVQDIKQCVRNKMIHSLLWITIFVSLMMRFANDFRENLWQIASRVTQKSLFTVTHALFFITSTGFIELTLGSFPLSIFYLITWQVTWSDLQTQVTWEVFCLSFLNSLRPSEAYVSVN